MNNFAAEKLSRMTGAGNTFFVIHNKAARATRAQFTRHICNDFVGFTTDGVLFLDSDSVADAKWDFYNSDGSTAEMCGNAARCAGLYFHTRVQAKEKIAFATLAGEIECQVLDAAKGIVRVKMPKMTGKYGPQEVQLGAKKVRGFFVDTGVPHFVIQHEPDEHLARALRKVTDFGPRGANITFVEFDEHHFLQAVTFERGVENFTLACGTGAVAAARFHHHCYPSVNQQTGAAATRASATTSLEAPVLAVEMPGGLLQVEWKDGTAFLTGPAEFDFDIQLQGANL